MLFNYMCLKYNYLNYIKLWVLASIIKIRICNPDCIKEIK